MSNRGIFDLELTMLDRKLLSHFGRTCPRSERLCGLRRSMLVHAGISHNIPSVRSKREAPKVALLHLTISLVEVNQDRIPSVLLCITWWETFISHRLKCIDSVV